MPASQGRERKQTGEEPEKSVEFIITTDSHWLKGDPMRNSRFCLLTLPLMLWFAFTTPIPAQQEAALSESQIREFLLTAKVIRERSTPKGITSPPRLTLSDGKITHDASFQKVNEYKGMMEFADGHREMNFKDSYKFDIAAYELAKMLGLGNMMPVTVGRKYKGDSGALTWWLPVKMDEATRLKQKLEPPDSDAWNQQMYKKRIFAELVCDTDPNLTNLLISADWHIWMIDFSRAFRMQKELLDPRNIIQSKCARQLLEKMRKLDMKELTVKTGKYLTPDEIKGVMARRDKIVAIYTDLIAKKGENEVLYDDPSVK
jgi:hypothetical protein